MAGIRPVCHNCGERCAGCHAFCERYAQARAEYDEMMAHHLMSREASAAAKDLQFHSMRRTRRGKHRR